MAIPRNRLTLSAPACLTKEAAVARSAATFDCLAPSTPTATAGLPLSTTTMVKPVLSTVDLAHIPPDLQVHVALYTDLKNSRYLRKQLIEQNKDFEYAFVDAKKILSTAHALAAVFRAITDMTNGRLKSHNVHSEVVLSLSPNNNIADALRKFGISDQTFTLLAIKITSQPADEVAAHLEMAVEGTAVEFSDKELASMCDVADIRKIYKLGAGKTKQSDQTGAELSDEERHDLEVAILGAIALRGAT